MKKITPAGWAAFVLLAAAIVSLTVWTARRRDAEALRVSASADAASNDLSAAPPVIYSSRPPTTVVTNDIETPEGMRALREAERQDSRKIVEAGRNRLLAQYQNERVDGSWAMAKEQTLEALSTSPLIEEVKAVPTSVEVHCRSTVCNVIAQFQTKLAADDWFTLYSMHAGAEMPNVSQQQTRNPDGTIRVELYGLARK